MHVRRNLGQDDLSLLCGRLGRQTCISSIVIQFATFTPQRHVSCHVEQHRALSGLGAWAAPTALTSVSAPLGRIVFLVLPIKADDVDQRDCTERPTRSAMRLALLSAALMHIAYVVAVACTTDADCASLTCTGAGQRVCEVPFCLSGTCRRAICAGRNAECPVSCGRTSLPSTADALPSEFATTIVDETVVRQLRGMLYRTRVWNLKKSEACSPTSLRRCLFCVQHALCQNELKPSCQPSYYPVPVRCLSFP